MLSETRKDFQVLAFVRDARLLSAQQSYANEFEKLFPKTSGKQLGILLEQGTQIPLQMVPSIEAVGKYNISTGTGDFIAYLEDKKTLSSTQSMSSLFPHLVVKEY